MRIIFTITCLFLIFSPLVNAQKRLSDEVTKYDHGNPSLGIVGFSGDDATRQILEKVLKRTDWFKVVDVSQASRAQIQ
ncbi:MAG: hypothetical protein IKO65_02085, partial [Victivallales bacterium]|nr:hypothetical protein [Victivallales bacterium]